MNTPALALSAAALVPLLVMVLAACVPAWSRTPTRLWPVTQMLMGLATAAALASLALQLSGVRLDAPLAPGLAVGLIGAWVALLVQGLGTVIAAFSARYLAGEPGQTRYAAALAGVLAAVQALVLADHWAVLILAWGAVGVALERLLCFYGDRPFATLAAHKKFLADRLADILLLAAAGLSIHTVGSGSLSDLFAHVSTHGAGPGLQTAAVLLALAVVIRTALLPVHGWLIQVMEAPTPVSALLHAGVVNLGGFVLIRFAPLLEAVGPARTLLVVLGVASAVLAGFVMLTRVSIKVRLAWSTLAQMGFMILECGLGLYTLAALHLIGHSIYKAHAFLSSGDAVRQARLRDLRVTQTPAGWSLWLAPVVAAAVVGGLVWAMPGGDPWPWWWSGVLALAWAPLLWSPRLAGSTGTGFGPVGTGVGIVAGLTLLALVGHALPLGTADQPHHGAGWIALTALALMYLGTAALQHPAWQSRLETLRRQSYAGFYLDEAYTRVALRVWPVRLPGNA